MSGQFYRGWGDNGPIWEDYPEDLLPQKKEQQPMNSIPNLLQLGNFALKNGLVSPEQAADTASPIIEAAMGRGKFKRAARRPAGAEGFGAVIGEPLSGPLALNTPSMPIPPAPPAANPAPATSVGPTEAVPGSAGALYEEAPEAPKGSGRTNTLENTESSTTTNTQSGSNKVDTHKILTLDPTELATMMSNIESIPDIREQRRGVRNLESLLKSTRSMPTDPFTAPLSAYLESIGDKGAVERFAGGAGLSPEQKLARIAAEQKDLQSARNNVSQRISDLIGKQKAGFQDQLLSQLWQQSLKDTAGSKAGSKAGDPTQKPNNQIPAVSKALKDVRDKFDKDVQPFNNSLAQISTIEGILGNEKEGSKLANKVVQTMLARARGEKGNLSYYEQAGTSEARDILNRLEQTIETLFSGDLTKENKAEIFGLVQKFREASNRAIDSYRQKHAEAGGATYGALGMKTEDFLPALVGVKVPRGAPMPPSKSDMIRVIENKSGKPGEMKKSDYEKHKDLYTPAKK